ncbi:MAG: diaminopimelate decarboxylase, partial [Deltaproteobacteria bacterium]|nr:diaminopimelate decarboxylase [Deltaproteobacteria bacterium]
MHYFNYKNNEMYCEEFPLATIAAEVGTPVYVYSHATLERHFTAFDRAFDGVDRMICFSVKSCSNIALLRLFASLGGGADIISGGELYRALKAGIPSQRIVYSGPGKTAKEIRAALEADILIFNIESPQELNLINQIAREMGTKARISIRVNPDVDPKTHPYISTGLKENKFGISYDQAEEVYLKASGLPGIQVIGVSCHIGSQMIDTGPIRDSVARLIKLLDRLKGHGLELTRLDLGGGLGISYDSEEPPEPYEYAEAIKEALDG